MTSPFTAKQRMLNAYRGAFSDRVAIAPEFWYYYPAKLLGVDMIEFAREVPFHLALKSTFEHFGCEGWGVAFAAPPNEAVTGASRDTWLDTDTLEVRTTIRTPRGELTRAERYSRAEPGWTMERPIKDLARDLPAWEVATFGGDPEAMDCSGAHRRLAGGRRVVPAGGLARRALLRLSTPMAARAASRRPSTSSSTRT